MGEKTSTGGSAFLFFLVRYNHTYGMIMLLYHDAAESFLSNKCLKIF